MDNTFEEPGDFVEIPFTSKSKIHEPITDRRKLEKNGEEYFAKVITPSIYDSLLPETRSRYRKHIPASLARLAAREVAASHIGQLVYPEITPFFHHSSKHNDHIIRSKFITDKTLGDHPELEAINNSTLPGTETGRKRRRLKRQELTGKVLSKLDPKSLVQSALFNWFIEHKDAHPWNFFVRGNKLVPLDFGYSFTQHPEDFTIPDKGDIISEYYLSPNDKHPLDVSTIEPYFKHFQKIKDIIKKQVLPHYPEKERKQMVETLKQKMRMLHKLRTTKSPKLGHLLNMLGEYFNDPARHTTV